MALFPVSSPLSLRTVQRNNAHWYLEVSQDGVKLQSPVPEMARNTGTTSEPQITGEVFGLLLAYQTEWLHLRKRKQRLLEASNTVLVTDITDLPGLQAAKNYLYHATLSCCHD